MGFERSPPRLAACAELVAPGRRLAGRVVTTRREREQRREDHARARELWDVQAMTVHRRLDRVAMRLRELLPDQPSVQAEIADQGEPDACIELGQSPGDLAVVTITIQTSLETAEQLADILEYGPPGDPG